jgi:dephospho-CoA kinase
MKLFGLTGGIGMGKSTSASLLSLGGIPVIDTDTLAREIVEPGQPALTEIAATFGPDLIDDSGHLRRAELAEIVFPSPEKLRQLESILHPIIRDRWRGRVEIWRREGRGVGVVVIPLLFETCDQSEFDAVICTACSAVTQQERLRARGWPSNQIEQRLAAQWPAEKKIAAADYVVWTEPALPLHQRQLARIFGGYFTPRG